MTSSLVGQVLTPAQEVEMAEGLGIYLSFSKPHASHEELLKNYWQERGAHEVGLCDLLRAEMHLREVCAAFTVAGDLAPIREAEQRYSDKLEHCSAFEIANALYHLVREGEGGTIQDFFEDWFDYLWRLMNQGPGFDFWKTQAL